MPVARRAPEDRQCGAIRGYACQAPHLWGGLSGTTRRGFLVDGDRRRQALANGRGGAVSCRLVRIDGSLCAGHLSDSVGGVDPLVWASRNASQIGRHLDVGLPGCLQLRAAKTGYASYKQSNSRLIVGFGPAGPGPIFYRG